jgi:hypothetical protein
MKSVMRIRVGAVLVALLAAMSAQGQVSKADAPGERVLLASAQTEPVNGQVVREIDDPHSGARWLLMRDPNHPTGPGRLVPVAQLRDQVPQQKPISAPRRPMPVIRTGDHLIVQEDTALVEVRLEAVALSPAVVGSPLKVRLKIGGVVAWAVAIAPGHAAFRSEAEMRP